MNAVYRQIEKDFANLQRSETTFKPSDGCRPDKLLTHFKQHFAAPPLQSTPAALISQPPPAFITNLQQLSVQNPVNHDPSTLDEVYDACKTAKNRKAISDIPSKFLKHARDCSCPQFLQQLYQLILEVWHTRQVPEEWSFSNPTCLWKFRYLGAQIRFDNNDTGDAEINTRIE